jgi:hypothetical protein
VFGVAFGLLSLVWGYLAVNRYFNAIEILDDWRCTYWPDQKQANITIWIRDRSGADRYLTRCQAQFGEQSIESTNANTGGTYMTARGLNSGNDPLMVEFRWWDVVIEKPELAIVVVSVAPGGWRGAGRQRIERISPNVVRSAQSQAASGRPAQPILEFGEPASDDEVAIVDEQNRPITSVRMWRVELRNVAEGTEASDVEVTLARSSPPLSVLPVDIHRFHDDNPPFTNRHEVRHDAPIIFDVIAKDHAADEFFLWRSDLPSPHYRFIYPLSPPERDTVLAALHSGGMTLTLRASGKLPLKTVEQQYRIYLDDQRRFMMEALSIP